MLNYLQVILAPYLKRDDERGASAVEYGLLIAGIAALIVAIVFLFGGTLSDIFDDTCKSVANNTTCTGDA